MNSIRRQDIDDRFPGLLEAIIGDAAPRVQQRTVLRSAARAG